MYTHIFTARAHDQKTWGITGLAGETEEETGHLKVVLLVPPTGGVQSAIQVNRGLPNLP